MTTRSAGQKEPTLSIQVLGPTAVDLAGMGDLALGGPRPHRFMSEARTRSNLVGTSVARW